MGDTFLLQGCIDNFRTTLPDIAELPGLVLGLGRELDAELRPTVTVMAAEVMVASGVPTTCYGAVSRALPYVTDAAAQADPAYQ
jgi:hypothetical protein